MLKRLMLSIPVILAALVLVGSIQAEDQKMSPEQAMMQMGPAPEMKQLDFLVGTWNVDMKVKMMPTDTAWAEAKGTATYQYILNGCVQQSTYKTSMMGMPFEGFMLQGYNADLKKWQVVWADITGGGRISNYTGEKVGDSTIMTGTELYMGQEILTKIISYNETPTRFDWKMESSLDGGKTTMVVGTAVYTKQM